MSDQPIDLVSAALVECQGKLKSANLDAKNPAFNSRYADLGAVIDASREALSSCGLAIHQTPTIVGEVVSVHTVIRHKSGQWLDCGVMSLPIGESTRNSDAQLAGSIITYLRRYAWSTVLGIYADHDDDGNDAPKGATKRSITQSATLTPVKPKDAPNQAPERPLASPERVTEVIRLLKAAEGGEQRNLVTDYLVFKRVLRAGQQLEEWPLAKVPLNGDEIQRLLENLDIFAHELRGPA